MKDITTMDTKSKQLTTLRTVQDSAVSHLKELKKRDKLILRQVNSIYGTTNPGGKVPYYLQIIHTIQFCASIDRL